LATIEGFPFVVTGSYEKGSTVAFTGFTPAWKERRSPWNRKLISSHQLDQELAADPQFRTCFALGMRMIAAALGEQPSTSFDDLLVARSRPLFEMLQDSPSASVELPESLRMDVTGHRATGVLTLRNGAKFARLLRIRCKWDGDASGAPYLTIYGDNYFDLLPGEEMTVTVEMRLSQGRPGPVEGTLVVEGSNVPPVEIPVVLEPR